MLLMGFEYQFIGVVNHVQIHHAVNWIEKVKH